jgi:hypothetical protein
MIILSTWPFNMTDSEAAIIIPTFVTILVFVLGLLAKWGYDHIQKREAIKTFRKVVFEWTVIIIDAIRAQSESLKELSDNMNKSQSLFPERYAFSRSMSDKLSELSAEKVVSVFIVNSRCKRKVEDKRAKYSFNLVSQYDFLASVESIVKEIYDVYNHQANDLREQWNTLLLELQHEIDAVKPETTRDYEAIETIRCEVNNYMKRRGQIDLIGEIYTQLIIPLNQTVDACKKSYPEVRRCQAVYECARKMLLLYNNWFAMKTGYAEVFNTYAASIDKSVDSLQGAIQYFKESTKVRCWPR